MNCISCAIGASSGEIAHDARNICRVLFDSEYLEDRLFWVFPTIERQLQRMFSKSDEDEFLHLQSSFFSWVENEGSDDHQKFARKHLKVINSKKPGLKQLAERALGLCEKAGIPFPDWFLGALPEIRGSLMHNKLSFTGRRYSLDEFETEATFFTLVLLYGELGLKPKDFKGALEAFGKELTGA